MFKAALRLVALTMVVAGAFYCGRASTFGKSEPVVVENAASLFQNGDLKTVPSEICKIDFQLQKPETLCDWENKALPPKMPLLDNSWKLKGVEWGTSMNEFPLSGKTIDVPARPLDVPAQRIEQQQRDNWKEYREIDPSTFYIAFDR